MPSRIAASVKEGATTFINVVPKDEDGTAVTPTAATWNLVNGDNETINDRSSVTIGSPSPSMDIQLDPADLIYSEGASRVLRVNYTYDSDRGSGLTGNDWVTFYLAEQNKY